ncbi:UNVERIFIED_CONTAM: hypothetical protein Sradi_4334400 [Sesamum radiatum]|uniref:PGG domain-containing protein n=1 Tax=Sesamum radiatum TaxID=300843 RepID=A0AAW2NP18_SESRA
MASSSSQKPWASSVNAAANFVPTKLWFNYTSTNYPAWKEQMLCLIQSQGLLGFIDGTIAPPPETISEAADATAAAVRNPDYDLWSRSDVLLKGWILCSLNDDIVYTVSAMKTSRDVWLELENKFRRLFNLPPPPPTATSTSTSTGGTEATTKVETQQSTGEKDLKEYLPLHRAALQGNWEAAKRIFDDDPGAMTASINLITATALHAAVGTGKAIHFVEKLVAAMPEESIGVMDDIGGTSLSVAAAVGNIAAATVLVNRMPNLLYIPNNFGNFPLQIAALYAQKDMLNYLISITKDDRDQNPYAGLAGLRLLIYVIDAEFFEIALYLVEKYPDLARLKLPDNTSALKKITAKKSVFVSERRFNFWERCISSCVSMETILRPQFTKGWDIESMARNSQPVFQSLQAMLSKFVDGLGAIKSIKEKTLLKQQALELVKCLCKEIELLSFMEAKDIYFDAIMVAAQLGIHEVVEEIVGTFPSAIYCLTPGSNQYIFHVAVENRSEHVYNLIYQMSDHKHLYSDLQDSNGNNLLHLAGKLAPAHKLNEISGAALQMQHEIQCYCTGSGNFVHPHSRERLNYAGKSPKMVFTEEHKILKEGGEKWMKDTSNSCTIAAALIATVMFAAAITVPGGNESSNGFPIFSGNSAFIVFAISDAVSLFTSATSLLMFLAILTSRYAEEDFLYVLPKRLIIGLGTLFLSITFMMAAFSATLYLVFGRKEAWVLIPVGLLACLPVTSFVLLQFPLLVDLIYSTYGPGIFGKQSSRPFH